MGNVVNGIGLYFRAISRKYSPEQLVDRCRELGLSWAAIGAVWQDDSSGTPKSGFMNPALRCRAYCDALAGAGISPYVWGYPWAGLLPEFVRGMLEASGDHRLILLDPELGICPKGRKASPADQAHARAMAQRMVHDLRAGGARRIGLSTYGIVPGFFPLDAFLREGLDFVGGQTYTDDATVDRSIASYLAAMREAGAHPQLVPNFGAYKWMKNDAGKRIAVPKTGAEQDQHLLEFVDEAEPVAALIGWAENFVRADNGHAIARFSRLMARGACALP